MPTLAELFQQALQHHQRGQLRQAEDLCRQVLQAEPRHAPAWHMLGLLARQAGRTDLAVEYLGQAVRILPDSAPALNNLGNFLREQGKLEKADDCLRQALRLMHGSAEVNYNLANVLRDQHKHREAEAFYREALRLKPAYAEAHNNLGKVLREQGKIKEAEDCFRQAVLMKQNFAEAHNNLGVVLQEQGRPKEAEGCFRQALRLKPDYAEALYNLGNALRAQDRLEEALPCFQKALRLRPDYAEALNNLGNLHKDLGQLEEAMAAYRQALQCQPDYVIAHSNLLYTLVFSPDHDAQAILEEHQRWNKQYAEPLARYIEPHENDRSPGRRLRIGYVSPDFCRHAESFFTLPLMSAHDHQAFEIFCYAGVERPDEITNRIRAHADVWRDIRRLGDEEVANQVRQDRIDILVDLTMHMAGNRLLVFARKPAPVQVCWLAYQGTTGLGTMDYRLTDPIIDPPGHYDHAYSEESVRLADAFWCYDPLGSEPEISALPALGKGQTTFGCLNNFCKVNDPVLRLWAEVLRAVPGARLLLLAAEGPHRRRARDVLMREGVQPERVTFVAKRPRPRYLELYHEIDIGLDTFPYTGQTTSLDAFWLGVPVITMVGNTAVARAGRSLLWNLGLPELVAETPEQFVDVAVQLAGDHPRLAEMRTSLRDRLRRSPLMDAPRFARNVEAAYRAMWQRWCMAP
jgi:protein O-GlcNAc transferase